MTNKVSELWDIMQQLKILKERIKFLNTSLNIDQDADVTNLSKASDNTQIVIDLLMDEYTELAPD